MYISHAFGSLDKPWKPGYLRSAYGAVCCHLFKPKNQTDDIFLAWSLTAEQPLVTLHVRCTPDADPRSIIPAINQRLKDRFGIAHSTIQIDPAECRDEYHR